MKALIDTWTSCSFIGRGPLHGQRIHSKVKFAQADGSLMDSKIIKEGYNSELISRGFRYLFKKKFVKADKSVFQEIFGAGWFLSNNIWFVTGDRKLSLYRGQSESVQEGNDKNGKSSKGLILQDNFTTFLQQVSFFFLPRTDNGLPSTRSFDISISSEQNAVIEM
jgi:hypothetical protein